MKRAIGWIVFVATAFVLFMWMPMNYSVPPLWMVAVFLVGVPGYLRRQLRHVYSTERTGESVRIVEIGRRSRRLFRRVSRDADGTIFRERMPEPVPLESGFNGEPGGAREFSRLWSQHVATRAMWVLHFRICTLSVLFCAPAPFVLFTPFRSTALLLMLVGWGLAVLQLLLGVLVLWRGQSTSKCIATVLLMLATPVLVFLLYLLTYAASWGGD